MSIQETRPARVTSHDVARLAGVSRSAVSQILNGNTTRFSEDTRERVLAAAKHLDYRPSRAGRELVTGHSSVILLAVPNTTFGRQLQDVVDGIASSSAALGLSVVVRYVGNDIDLTIDSVLDLRPAVTIDFGVFDEPTHNRLAAVGLRVVPRTRSDQSPAHDPNYVVGRIQAQRLLIGPPRRIVYAQLADARDDPYGPVRLSGVADYAREARVPAPDVCRVPLDADQAFAALEPFLSGAERLGIACYNDDVAFAVMGAARRAGRSVPDEVAIVGVDRSDAGQLVSPRFTTVEIDLPALLGRFLSPADIIAAPAGPREGQANLGDFVHLVPGETA